MSHFHDAFLKSLQTGNRSLTKGEWQTALEAFKEAHRYDPAHPDPLFGIGNLLRKLNRPLEAMGFYRQALDRDDRHYGSHNNLGDLLRELGQLTDASSHYRRAIEAAPSIPEPHNNLAALMIDLGHFNEAIHLSTRALELRPNYAKAYFNRGVSRYRLRQLRDALEDFKSAIQNRMRTAPLFSNAGVTALESGESDQAMNYLSEALKIDPHYAEAEWNLACVHLKRGEFERGWELYEARWRWRQFPSSPPLPNIEIWDGSQSLEGKRIFVLCEQGLGDFLQFSRYFKLLANLRPSQILVDVHSSLRTLVAHNYPSLTTIERTEIDPTTTDFQTPLLSLPRAFRTTVSSIPEQDPPLKSPRCLDLGLDAPPETPKIGLVWSGGSRLNNFELESINQRRNIPFSTLALLQESNAIFFSLQKGDPWECSISSELRAHWQKDNFINLGPLISDFSDTAALINKLDLLITVDTSTAHLAGAMGKPVWLLNRYAGCWRWIDGLSSSPWYPSMRIFQQPREGDWCSVIRDVRSALEKREW
jgi:tetratricopeptide (TPR) repeat protein